MRFRVLNRDSLADYREACLLTAGKDISGELHLPEGKDMTDWWIEQIVANHSTIRAVHFRLVDRRPKTVIAQLIRATKGHPQPEVQSSRPDWNGGKPRSADPYEEILFMQDHTAESFVEMAGQRLCMKTEEGTRKAMQEMVRALRESGDSFLRAVGYCCAPQCYRYGKCPQLHSCGKFKPMAELVKLKYHKGLVDETF